MHQIFRIRTLSFEYLIHSFAMTDNRLLDFSTDTSLFDTYVLYGIIGLLIFIASIGLIILIVTSCCWCFYSISFCFCCYHRHRHFSYKINRRFQKVNEKKNISCLKRQPSDITNFSQLYDSCPHLINNKAMLTPGLNNQHFDTSCTTINTLVNPITPCGSIRSLRDSDPPVQNNLVNRPFSYIKKLNDLVQISRQVKSNDHSNSPTVISIDITGNSPSSNGTRTHSPSTNIYESVISNSNINSLSDRTTPIYETEWTHNLQRLLMKKRPSRINNGISVIKLPSSSPPDLVPTIHYFQQKQHPYDKFLANRKNTSDSMRRANMLKRIKDDSAFLY